MAESPLRLRMGTVDLGARRLTRQDGATQELTAIERDLLRFLAANPGVVHTRDDLLVEVWGYARGVGSRTAEVTVARLRSKVELDPTQPDHLVTVYGKGYCFVPEAVRVACGWQSTPLGPEATRFFGREDERVQLAAAMEQHRSVTLLGMGGVGKTRMAREVLRAQGDRLSWFCDITDVDTDAALLQALAGTAGIDAQTPDALVGRLAEAGDALLVLDNVESAVEAVARLVPRLLGETSIQLLATSRVPIEVGGERVVPISPMDVPPAGTDLDEARRHSLVSLLCDRVGAVDPEWRLTDANLGAALELLAAVDGLPLAVELAAPRVPLLTLRGLVDRLSPRLLSTSQRERKERHRSLDAVLQASWELLTPWQQDAFVQCSVFVGGFWGAAAEQVVDTSTWPSKLVALDGVQALLAASLLEQEAQGRLRMLNIVRDFAEIRLVDVAVRDRHAATFAPWLDDDFRRKLGGLGGRAYVALVVQDFDNLHAAAQHFAHTGSADLAAGAVKTLVEVLNRTGPMDRSREITRWALGVPGLGRDDRAWLLLNDGVLEHSDPDARVQRYEEALSVAADPDLQIEACARLMRDTRNMRYAEKLEALVADHRDDRAVAVHGYARLAEVYVGDLGDLQGAHDACEAGLDLCPPNMPGTRWILGNMSCQVHGIRADLPRLADSVEDLTEAAQASGQLDHLVMAELWTAVLSGLEGDYDAALARMDVEITKAEDSGMLARSLQL